MISASANKFRQVLKKPMSMMTYSQFSTRPNISQQVIYNQIKRGFATSASDSAHGAQPERTVTDKFGDSFPKSIVNSQSSFGKLHSHERIRYYETEDDLLQRHGEECNWSVHLADRDNLRAKLKAMQSDGPADLMIIADFDQTISSYRVPQSMKELRAERLSRLNCLDAAQSAATNQDDGPMMTQATIQVMLEHDRITQEDRDDTRRLYLKYRPIEMDQSIGVAEKYGHMLDWLTENLKLFSSLEPTDSEFRSMVAKCRMACRYGILDLLEQTRVSNIPFIVLSGGVREVIEVIFYEMMREQLLKSQSSYDFKEFDNLKELYNLIVISNTFHFKNIHSQETGRIERMVCDYDRNILTSMNKYEFLNELHKKSLDPRLRKNLIVTGDQLHDLKVIEPSNHENILSIGFLNEMKNEHMFENYLKHFDIVICRDGPLLPMNAIMDMISMNPRDKSGDYLQKYEKYPELHELCELLKTIN